MILSKQDFLDWLKRSEQKRQLAVRREELLRLCFKRTGLRLNFEVENSDLVANLQGSYTVRELLEIVAFFGVSSGDVVVCTNHDIDEASELRIVGAAAKWMGTNG